MSMFASLDPEGSLAANLAYMARQWRRIKNAMK